MNVDDAIIATAIGRGGWQRFQFMGESLPRTRKGWLRIVIAEVKGG